MSFLTLPIEAIQAIMCTIADISTLKSLRLTCSAFQSAFTDAESLISAHVLRNEIGLDALSEAVARLDSSKVRSWTRESTMTFVKENLQTRKPPTRTWNFKDVSKLSHFHNLVSYFTNDLAVKALEPLPQKASYTPSKTETSRIIRALYRFEIYCNIFRDPKEPLLNLAEQKYLLFDHYSPWENEQLVCIFDYLFRLITPAFNEVAEHDIMWGQLRIGYANLDDPGDLEPILARGLASVSSIVTAETYERRYNLLYPAYPEYTDKWLYEALKAANTPSDNIALWFYDADRLAQLQKPFFNDPVSGPYEVWHCILEVHYCSSFINNDMARCERRCAYVMWDKTRLDELDIFDDDSHDPWPDVELSKSVNSYSYERRWHIYLGGGSGWWSHDNESHVVWPDIRHLRIKEQHHEVKSLEEAREFMSMLKLPDSAR